MRSLNFRSITPLGEVMNRVFLTGGIGREILSKGNSV